MNKEEIMEKIFEIFMSILFIGLFVIVLYGVYNHTKYCEINPNEETCKPRETTSPNNNNGGIRCGWVFGHGFKCGIGF